MATKQVLGRLCLRLMLAFVGRISDQKCIHRIHACTWAQGLPLHRLGGAPPGSAAWPLQTLRLCATWISIGMAFPVLGRQAPLHSGWLQGMAHSEVCVAPLAWEGRPGVALLLDGKEQQLKSKVCPMRLPLGRAAQAQKGVLLSNIPHH